MPPSVEAVPHAANAVPAKSKKRRAEDEGMDSQPAKRTRPEAKPRTHVPSKLEAKKRRNRQRRREKRAQARFALSSKKPEPLNVLPGMSTVVGTACVFGNGDCGQLGLGDERTTVKAPFPLPALDNIVEITAGGLHCLAVTNEGKVISWGCNDKFVLGRSGDEYEPAPVEGLDEVKIVRVVGGDNVSLALTDQGQVYGWGVFRNNDGKDIGFSRDIPLAKSPTRIDGLLHETIVELAAGVDHVLALSASGRVYGWGNGQQYQLGKLVPEDQVKEHLFPQPLPLQDIVHIASGSYHSFAVNKEGQLFAWGLNNFYQCGILAGSEGEEPVVKAPTLVEGLRGKRVKQVSAGEHHSLALLDSGELFSFGRADSSQLGLPTTMLAQLNENTNEGSFKQAVAVPAKIPDLPEIVQIACGSNHNLALTKGNELYAWGFGESGALGTGKEEDEVTPCLVRGKRIIDYQLLKISGGGQHSLLLAAKP
ncbi:uncharacterized protein VTP21DRAFT_4665 [Calcarisporiella thermophila]|uniref:uncharacterized protein n=1 Tax=Calcarisporiella thermophila TaxID=911321 RepID=UPI0037448992